MIFCAIDPETGDLFCNEIRISRKSVEWLGSLEKAIDNMLDQVRACLIATAKDDRKFSLTVEAQIDRLAERVKRLEDRDLGRPVKLPERCPECGGTLGWGSCEGHPGCSRCLWEFKP
jgi:hypothetical protein